MNEGSVDFEELARAFLVEIHATTVRVARSSQGLRVRVPQAPPAPHQVPPAFYARFFELDFDAALRETDRDRTPLCQTMRARVHSLRGEHDAAIEIFRGVIDQVRGTCAPFSAIGILSVVGCFASDSAKLRGERIVAPLAASVGQLQSRLLFPYRPYAERARGSAAESVGDMRSADARMRSLGRLKARSWDLSASLLAIRASYAFSMGDRPRAFELARGASLAIAGCNSYGLVWACHRLVAFYEVAGEPQRASAWRDVMRKSGCHRSGVASFLARADQIVRIFERSGTLAVC